ncbi:MAG: hypothetical protein IID15_07875, partial [Candidatus Marinimicrobia bacterium]|nr:hypothetical protein [Candidatus Neomarinimicrobiota bacterium]
VGINRGAVREAILEDSVQNRTYFILEGQIVKGMKVEKITANSVIFSFEGEEVEIV